MNRAKLCALAVLSTGVLMASALATTSFALPELLNSKKEVPAGVVIKSALAKTSGEFTILSGFAATKCAEEEGEAETEGTGVLGKFHKHLLKCTTNLGGECTGLGETAQSILILGSFHIVYDTLGVLGAAILFLLAHLHFGCTVAGVEKLILILGKTLCLLGSINSLVTTEEIKCLGSAGDPKEVRYWNDAGTEVNIAEGLLASENEGVTYKMAAENGTGKIESTETLEIMA